MIITDSDSYFLSRMMPPLLSVDGSGNSASCCAKRLPTKLRHARKLRLLGLEKRALQDMAFEFLRIRKIIGGQRALTFQKCVIKFISFLVNVSSQNL